MRPAVSVVIATRNYGRFLAGAIESVLKQTWTDFELLVIDDGSTDHTSEVVQPFLSDQRVHYHRTDGLGQSRAKNLGIQFSTAPLIAFLDGDDAWLPEKLDRQLPLFRDGRVGIVYGRRRIMGENGEDLPTPPSQLSRGDLSEVLIDRNPICFSSVVVRREVFETVGAFDENLQLAIDYDLWLRASRRFDFDFVDEPVVRYRTGHANLSSRLRERIMTVLSILRRFGGEPGVDPRAINRAIGSTCRTMGFVARQEGVLPAARWYFRAALHDGAWRASIKGILGSVLGR